MKTDKSVFTGKSVAALFALVLTLVATTAALAAPSIARFEATGDVLGVGPGPDYEVNTRFIRTGRDRDLRLVIIRTSDEQVGGDLSAVFNCADGDGGTSCAAITNLLTVPGSGLLSFHDSVALLSDPVVHANPLDPSVDAITGSLSGVLRGDFTIANPAAGTASGKAVLRIEGSGTYGCFGPDPLGIPPALVPYPLSFCESGPGLFVPMQLNIVDSGVFSMNKFTGAFEDLAHLGGRIEVSVNGFTGQPNVDVGDIHVTDGRAIFH